MPEAVISLQQTGEEFHSNIENSIQNCKVFEVDNGIKKLLCLTDPPNKNDEVFLPFPDMFLDVEFTKEELADLGIEIDADHIVGIMFKEGRLVDRTEKVEIIGKDLNITMSSLQSNGQYWFDNFNKNWRTTIKWDLPLQVKENPTTDTKAREFVHKFVINFLNFMNNPEVEFVEHSRSEKNRERREKQGKPVIPSSFTINVYGKLKEYIDEAMSGATWTYNYRFWVRGHFRDLVSKRYVNKKRIWILPFVKGKGVLIDKSYKVQLQNS